MRTGILILIGIIGVLLIVTFGARSCKEMQYKYFEKCAEKQDIEKCSRIYNM